MLTIYGERRRFCDRVPRRDFLRIGSLALGGLALPDLLRATARADSGNAGPDIHLEPFAEGADKLYWPVYATAPTDRNDSAKLYVVDRGGPRPDPAKRTNGEVYRVEEDDKLGTKPVLSVEVLNVGLVQQTGLLCLAFHPDPKMKRLYVYYVDRKDKQITGIVAEHEIGDKGVVQSGTPLLEIPFPDDPEPMHHGGWIGFDPKDNKHRYLYYSSGDGVRAPADWVDTEGLLDPKTKWTDIPAQDTIGKFKYCGKVLRIDLQTKQTKETRNVEIIALGLREPYRCSFDRKTGNLFIGDVGSAEGNKSAAEEINVITNDELRRADPKKPINFGWPCVDGVVHRSVPKVLEEHPAQWLEVQETSQKPAHYYLRAHLYPQHAKLAAFKSGASIIGGYVYRGNDHRPELWGRYFFADFSGFLWSVQAKDDGTFDLNKKCDHHDALRIKDGSRLCPMSFAEDAAGELYVVGKLVKKDQQDKPWQDALRESYGAVYKITLKEKP